MSNSPAPKFTPAEARSLYDAAHAVGHTAATGQKPTPMIVTDLVNPFNDRSAVNYAWFEPEGPCGFAWVNVKPGNSQFARWLKTNTHARADSYYGGVSLWVRDYEQSYERKVAYARAFAAVLTEAGVRALGTGRLD